MERSRDTAIQRTFKSLNSDEDLFETPEAGQVGDFRLTEDEYREFIEEKES